MKVLPAFTFLELLIAVSLFSVGVISVVKIFPVNRRYLNQSANTTQAAYLAQEELETIRGLSYANLTLGTYEAKHAVSTSGEFSQYQRQTVVGWVDSQSNWQTSSAETNLKQITITVYWQEGTDNSINRTFTLTSFSYQ